MTTALLLLGEHIAPCFTRLAVARVGSEHLIEMLRGELEVAGG